MLTKTPGTRLTVLPRRVACRDARTPATMWGLLVWAFKRELVRVLDARGSEGFTHGNGGSNTGTVCRVLATGIVGSGPTARISRVAVPADAEWLHGLVRSLDRDEYWLIVRSAEADRPPEWNPYIERARVLPVLKANGRPRMIVCPVQRRPVACRIETFGMPDTEADAIRDSARERYAHWYRLLWAMREKLRDEDTLSRWRVTGIGAEAEPWSAH
jgi:hypothetical protein